MKYTRQQGGSLTVTVEGNDRATEIEEEKERKLATNSNGKKNLEGG